ncbi:MAG: hypothetical protein H7Y32_02920 [Chloroflexales bacterium]|nr:hypothetical protein [Chloroflexales bacterium]
MATRADFTPEEWTTIYQSPGMAGMVVMLAGKSGPFQAVREMFAVGKALADQQDSSNGIISAIVSAAKAKERAEAAEQPKTLEEARTLALAHIRQTAMIVDAKAPADAAQFKSWLVDVGQKVAEAAKEGGFLGFGGTQVTDEERAAVSELATTLGH